MSKKIKFSKKAIKDLLKIPKNKSLKIRKKIKEYAVDSSSQKNNMKKLKNSEYTRLRVGNYRVIFTETNIIISIIKIGTRGDIYKNL